MKGDLKMYQNGNAEKMRDDKKPLILVINPGSTSTKLAIFQGENLISEKNLSHDASRLMKYKKIYDQMELRMEAISEYLKEESIEISDLACVVGRGGLLKPMESGTYFVDEVMCQYLKTAPLEHASNLGALLADKIAKIGGVPSYIVDPVVVDEMEPLARISGFKGIERKSIFHALNQKATAKKMAENLNKKYQKSSFIVAHLGGGITVGVHKNGRVIDVNNGLDGDGPFSTERAGGLPVCDIINLCFHGTQSEDEIRKSLVGCGGLVSYFGTNDGRIVEKRIQQGEADAKLIYEAMAYQIAKEIGSCATVLNGVVDAIVITGGLAYSKMLVEWIKNRVEFIAPVIDLPGENEMEALAGGALRVLSGLEECKYITL